MRGPVLGGLTTARRERQERAMRSGAGRSFVAACSGRQRPARTLARGRDRTLERGGRPGASRRERNEIGGSMPK